MPSRKRQELKGFEMRPVEFHGGHLYYVWVTDFHHIIKTQKEQTCTSNFIVQQRMAGFSPY